MIFGTHIMKSLKELERKQWWTVEAIKANQDSRLNKLIKHSYENVPYWRELFSKLKLKPADIRTRDDLSKLPVLSKDDIRKNLNSMLAGNFPVRRFIEQHSSGSTGEPLRYYSGKHHYSWRLASMFRFWKWAGYEFGQSWLRVSLWERNSLKDKIWDFASRCNYISLFEFNKESLMKSRQTLERYKPKLVRGYAGALYIIADYLDKAGQHFDFVRSVITTGDILFPHYRKKIEKVFNTKVFDTYGGEGISISGQCEKGSYHIDDNNVILEFLDDDGNSAKTDQLGNIIVTDLNNFCMPFIRYAIQDIGVLKTGNCDCGRRLAMMEQPQGRDTDIIYLSNENYLIVHFFTGLFEFYDEVNQFQVEQTGTDEIRLKLCVSKNFNDRILRQIKQKIRSGAGCKIYINVDIVDTIPPTQSGKRRFVVSKARVLS